MATISVGCSAFLELKSRIDSGPDVTEPLSKELTLGAGLLHSHLVSLDVWHGFHGGALGQECCMPGPITAPQGHNPHTVQGTLSYHLFCPHWGGSWWYRQSDHQSWGVQEAWWGMSEAKGPGVTGLRQTHGGGEGGCNATLAWQVKPVC